jgi:mRNA-degrading endonuclease RelE of RelBE toxin-antitoxin system
MVFAKTKDFEKNLKSLGKRFLTLGKALEVLEAALEQSPTPHKSTLIDGLGEEIIFPVIKMPIKCKNVTGWRFRVVYVYNEEETTITFLEVYFKGDKENHDQELIKAYFKTDNA